MSVLYFVASSHKISEAEQYGLYSFLNTFQLDWLPSLAEKKKQSVYDHCLIQNLTVHLSEHLRLEASRTTSTPQIMFNNRTCFEWDCAAVVIVRRCWWCFFEVPGGCCFSGVLILTPTEFWQYQPSEVNIKYNIYHVDFNFLYIFLIFLYFLYFLFSC